MPAGLIFRLSLLRQPNLSHRCENRWFEQFISMLRAIHYCESFCVMLLTLLLPTFTTTEIIKFVLCHIPTRTEGLKSALHRRIQINYCSDLLITSRSHNAPNLVTWNWKTTESRISESFAFILNEIKIIATKLRKPLHYGLWYLNQTGTTF